MQILSFDHLRCGAEEKDMAAPECFPGELSLLYPDDEKLNRPKERPRTVC